ncbi:MAG: AMP-binding protein [Janthinobacterium lividum]
MHPNFAERLFSELQRHPTRPVLRWPTAQPGASATTLSGAQLLARVAAWQHALEARGPLPLGAPVLLAHPASPELVAALLAVLGLGAVPVLPPAGATARQLLALVRAERIKVAGVNRSTRRRLGWLGRLLGYRLVAASPAADPDAATSAELARPALRAVAATQPALVSHSSGSVAGRPTAIWRSHAVLQAQHEALRTQFPPWVGQRDFPLFPNVILHNLAVGALSVVPDLPGGRLASLAPARLVAQLAAEGVHTLTGNVFYFERLLAYLADNAMAFPRVRALGIGGSPVPEALLAGLAPYFPQATRYVIYGSSEAEPIAVRAVAPGPSPDPRLGYCVGQPVAGLAIRLQAPAPVWQPEGITNNLLLNNLNQPAFQAGEIMVRGAHVALPTTTGPAGWLATGDFGYFDAAGQLWLVGRRGAAALVRGVGHYQVEHVLRHLPGVAQVAALPLPNATEFEVFIVGTASAEAVRATVEAAFGPGLVAAVRHRARLAVDGRHLSKIRYDLVR